MLIHRRGFIAGMAALVAVPRQAGAVAPITDPELARFIAGMPKAEYHVHLEGTLEADMKFALARRNGLKLPFADVAAMKASYDFHDLPSFLKIYYDGMKVLLKEQDFYDLAYAYLVKAASQNVIYAEMFFDPQEHLKRGVPMAAVIGGITRARRDAQAKLGIRSQLILCFVRDLSAESAMAALDAALPFKADLVGVGLDSDEKDNPPEKFRAHFAKARVNGLHVTAHCDVDQVDSLGHIRTVLLDLKADRIDHGGNIVQSPELVAIARQRSIYFTVCPTFSGTLRAGLKEPVDVVRAMLDAGLKVTISSDDPAYMGSEYLNDVLIRAVDRSNLTRDELTMIARNGFEAAWLPEADKSALIARLESYLRSAA
ncbi:adenosine deaminase [Novosphingobium sp. CF614]|uniref:adenosine deaminase n=1 Tax=Novosphingobium sp. CF614 TaxID=1884364 RepID=UPI0008F34C95|nr:adenosine deaminase [Novosphingobium sp. CF614]SFF95406.1 adenosine deaminase [Novosphingobium sp. CF614]